ncbi:MAG: iron dependent repressor, metal binding and dimerization domain protein [Clostridiaceae bacterium]|nr:iron dependent repressor, metal binding and dimerization domain protein [Clostridiaceae bacterium]
MHHTDGFYTMKGYALNTEDELTSAMEDYLEMIARLMRQNKSVRVSDLSKMLHVKASSVTKMVQQLGQFGLIQAEKYGDIYLTEKGQEAGNYLLYRHEVIHRFLCTLNHSDNELEQVEKIEHFLDRTTVKNLEELTVHLTKKLPTDEFT